MLESLSLCLIVGGIYVLLLLLIVEGWLLVWQYFLSRFDLMHELLADDLTVEPFGGPDAPNFVVTSDTLNSNRCLFNAKDGLDTTFFFEPCHRRVCIVRGREAS
ncbi:hypothetical protein HPB50_025553 [Hyalomma asiaticum]|uniref:Uncharacterized protein n=1 Tax=Hyalomma asiaticum TaxID=266040 RepID=A0ACB7RLG3_HYAAI|nr:hypothetical protein HPB50_025553 [Hyalomma asiaticum]